VETQHGFSDGNHKQVNAHDQTTREVGLRLLGSVYGPPRRVRSDRSKNDPAAEALKIAKALDWRYPIKVLSSRVESVRQRMRITCHRSSRDDAIPTCVNR